MKRWILPILLLFVLFVAGCGKANWDISIEKAPFFKLGIEAPFIVKITNHTQPVSKLTVHATFEMEKMNHGSIDIDLIEKDSGQYEGFIEFPMQGEYDVFLTIANGKSEKEEHLTVQVKQEDAVAIINGEKVYQADLDFYLFINQLYIAINRELDKTKYMGTDYTTAMNKWDEQEKAIANENVLLTQMIRLRSIALLAKEKGFTASEREIEAELNRVKQSYGASEVAMKMIQEFGERKFWEKEKDQYADIILSTKVQQDIIVKIRQEQPMINEQEIMYLANKRYEEILVSQVNSLEIQFLNNIRGDTH